MKNPREAALFLTRFGTRVGKSMLDVIVRKHGKAARIPRPVSPHVLGHRCATHLLEGGADVRHVQELLGHKSLQSTPLDSRVGVEDLREVLATGLFGMITMSGLEGVSPREAAGFYARMVRLQRSRTPKGSRTKKNRTRSAVNGQGVETRMADAAFTRIRKSGPPRGLRAPTRTVPGQQGVAVN